LNGYEICVIDVSHSAEPANLATEKGAEFFIRVGPTSWQLDAEETMRYISTKWG